MSENRIGFIWLYCLVVLFVLGIMELLIIPAIEAKLVPTLIDTMMQTNPSDVAAYTTQVNNIIKFVDITMYVLMFVTFIYMVISIFKKEEYIYPQ